MIKKESGYYFITKMNNFKIIILYLLAIVLLLNMFWFKEMTINYMVTGISIVYLLETIYQNYLFHKERK